MSNDKKNLLSNDKKNLLSNQKNLLGHQYFLIVKISGNLFKNRLLKNLFIGDKSAFRFKYPVSINGKVKLQLELPYDWAVEHIENHIKKEVSVQQLLQNKIPKRIIIVPRKIINIVI